MRHRRTALSTLLALTLATLAHAAGPQSSDAANIGLHGPVRNLATKVEALAPDPRTQPYISLSVMCADCVFDARGNLVRRSDAAATGDLSAMGRTEIDRDELGRMSEERAYGPHGELASRTEYRNGAAGPLEVQSWIGDRLISRAVNRYDEHGRQIAARTFNQDGSLEAESLTRWSSDGQALESVLRFPQRNQEQIQTYSYAPDGNLVAMETRLNGELMMRVSFDGERVTSWFMRKDANFGVGFMTSPAPGLWVGFSSDPATGALLRTEYVHGDREGNIDSDEVRHFDANGELAEKLTFDYEWDAFGNWTRRTAYVWDVSSGTKTAVQRITRSIAYR